MADHLVSLKRTKQEKKGNSDGAVAVGGSHDDFPYGTSISLDGESLKKLGITTLPQVGDELIVASVGRVTSVSERSDSNRKTRNVTIQLERMDIGPLKSPKAGTSEDAISDAISRET